MCDDCVRGGVKVQSSMTRADSEYGPIAARYSWQKQTRVGEDAHNAGGSTKLDAARSMVVFDFDVSPDSGLPLAIRECSLCLCASVCLYLTVSLCLSMSPPCVSGSQCVFVSLCLCFCVSVLASSVSFHFWIALHA